MGKIVSYTEYLQDLTLNGIENSIKSTLEVQALSGKYTATLITKEIEKYESVAKKLGIPYVVERFSITFDWS